MNRYSLSALIFCKGTGFYRGIGPITKASWKVQGCHLGGAGGGGGGGGTTAPPSLNLPPTSPMPQEVTAAGFPLFLPKIQMCHHFNITFSYILHVFFFVFFLRLRQGRSQGTLVSDKKLIFKGSPALLELTFVPNFCWNTLLMWLQKTRKIAQNQKISRGGLTAPPPRNTLLIRPSSLAKPSLPPPPPAPQEKSEVTPLEKSRTKNRNTGRLEAKEDYS